MPREINAALQRCVGASSEKHQLPWDFDCFPVLKVNSAGRCVAIRHWMARIGGHVGRGDTPLAAIQAICASRNGGTK